MVRHICNHLMFPIAYLIKSPYLEMYKGGYYISTVIPVSHAYWKY